MTKTVLTTGTTGGLGKEFGKWFADNGNNLVIIVNAVIALKINIF
ncbi:hypothetical protein [Pediococcus pentosaceus]|nr:hypothetical protein [Pediococcus pentosaceus]